MSRTCKTFPDDSPLRHSAWRDRLQKCAWPVSAVSRTASRSAQANIRTPPLRMSCAITGTKFEASKATAASRASVLALVVVAVAPVAVAVAVAVAVVVIDTDLAPG